MSKEEQIKHEKGSIRIKKYHIEDLKQLFNLMGVSYIHPDGEAEAYAAELCRKGFVDYVVSEDMDTLVYGCPKMIRSCLDKSIPRRDVVSVINLETILKDFEMDMKSSLHHSAYQMSMIPLIQEHHSAYQYHKIQS